MSTLSEHAESAEALEEEAFMDVDALAGNKTKDDLTKTEGQEGVGEQKGAEEEDELDLPELEPCVICERFHPDSDCVACLRTCFLCFRHCFANSAWHKQSINGNVA